MNTFKRILFPVDFSKASQRAFEYAVDLARHFKARLYLVHVVSPLAGMGRSDINAILEMLKRGASKHLVRMADQARAKGVSPVIVIRIGETDSLIRETALAKKADLVVIGSHGKRGFRRWMLGSTTEHLLRQLSIPMLILPATRLSHTKVPRIQNILLTTDFSKGATAAASYAFSMAREFHACVTLLHVLPDFNLLADHISMGERTLLIQDAQRRLLQLVPPHFPKRDRLTAEAAEGVAAQQILLWTEKSKADLLVINIHGKGFIERALLGATAERVIRASPCPILAVPPESNVSAIAARNYSDHGIKIS